MEIPVKPQALKVFGKESIFFGRNMTRFIAEDLVKNAVPTVRMIVIITDAYLEKIHLEELITAFKPFATQKVVSEDSKGSRTRSSEKYLLIHVIPPGESSKCRKVKDSIEDFLLEQGCNRDTCIVAFGGGVVGDLVGFVASTFLRGVPLVHIPTTLLAMADSSIGGKTGIDTPGGKNLIGTTYEAVRTYVDLKYLVTLPQREFSNGMSEVIKTCAISSEAEFELLEANIDNINRLVVEGWKNAADVKHLEDLVLFSIKFKASVVTEDKHDWGRRHLLNFGHTVGHALESHYSPNLLHGEAIAIGMVLEQEIAASMNIVKDPNLLKRLTEVLHKTSLPTSVVGGEEHAKYFGTSEHITSGGILQKMKLDKKNSSDQICMTFLSKFGSPYGTKATPVNGLEIDKLLSRHIKPQKGRKINKYGPTDSPYALNCLPPKCSDSQSSVILIGSQASILGSKLAEALSLTFVEGVTVETLPGEGHVATLPESEPIKNLTAWMRRGGISIHVIDSLEDTTIDFRSLQDASNYTYFFQGNGQSSAEDFKCAIDSLVHLVSYAKGQLFGKVMPSRDFPSFFVSLLLDDVTPLLDQLPTMITGTAALEIRVDIMRNAAEHANTVGKFERFLAQQVSQVRRAIKDHPIIYTIRTAGQGGYLDSSEMLVTYLLNLFQYGIRLGCEFIDLEMDLDRRILTDMMFVAGRKSRIVASHHCVGDGWDWLGDKAEEYLDSGLHFGDIIKLVSVAQTPQDNQNVLEFSQNHYDHNKSIPLIAFNMGKLGQPSRIRNRYLTPVTHEDLPAPSRHPALSQLTCKEILAALTQEDVIKPKQFFIFGQDISFSLSPLIHNANFTYFNLPHTYAIKDSGDLDEIKAVIHSSSFGGGSVTIPLKEKVIPLLDSVSKEVELIQAVNTVVVKPDGKLHGENTDWLGIRHFLDKALGMPSSKLAKSCAMLIGAGGTARAALYALNTFGFEKIYLYNRTESKVEELARCFSEAKGRTTIKVYKGNKVSLTKPECPLVAIIDTTPGYSGMCPNQFVNEVFREGIHSSILVKLAYGKVAPELVDLKPWIRTVTGEDILIGQAIEQAILWTGLKPDAKYLKQVVEIREMDTTAKKNGKKSVKAKPPK